MSHIKLHSNCYHCRFQKFIDRGGRQRLYLLRVTWLQHYLFICIDIFASFVCKEANRFPGSLYLFIKRCNSTDKIEANHRNLSQKFSYKIVTKNFICKIFR